MKTGMGAVARDSGGFEFAFLLDRRTLDCLEVRQGGHVLLADSLLGKSSFGLCRNMLDLMLPDRVSTPRAYLGVPTVTPSHALTLFIPSVISLKPSFVSSSSVFSRSLTDSLSLLVPNKLSCCDMRAVLLVNVNSFPDSPLMRRSNSGSSE